MTGAVPEPDRILRLAAGQLGRVMSEVDRILREAGALIAREPDPDRRAALSGLVLDLEGRVAPISAEFARVCLRLIGPVRPEGGRTSGTGTPRPMRRGLRGSGSGSPGRSAGSTRGSTGTRWRFTRCARRSSRRRRTGLAPDLTPPPLGPERKRTRHPGGPSFLTGAGMVRNGQPTTGPLVCGPHVNARGTTGKGGLLSRHNGQAPVSPLSRPRD